MRRATRAILRRSSSAAQSLRRSSELPSLLHWIRIDTSLKPVSTSIQAALRHRLPSRRQSTAMGLVGFSSILPRTRNSSSGILRAPARAPLANRSRDLASSTCTDSAFICSKAATDSSRICSELGRPDLFAPVAEGVAAQKVPSNEIRDSLKVPFWDG